MSAMNIRHPPCVSVKNSSFVPGFVSAMLGYVAPMFGPIANERFVHFGATMMLECDVTFDEGGCAGFSFGGSEADETWTELCLDARTGMLHYEGYYIDQIREFDPAMFTLFDFSQKTTHHVKLVCENEIVVMYVDDVKALSSRIAHSIDGAHIGVFADGCNAEFSNISMKCPE